jgi:ABC-2 type transport system permease protein
LGREIGRAFRQPLAWVFMTFFLLLTGVNFQAGVAALNREPSTVTALEAFFNSLLFWFPFLLSFPLLTMGQPSADAFGPFLGAYAIVLLAGAFYLSLGCLASALTDNQIVAGMACAALVCLSFFLGILWFLYPSTSPLLREIAYTVSTIEHMADFSRGIFDSRPVVLYLSLTAFVLFLTYLAMQRRRWRA